MTSMSLRGAISPAARSPDHEQADFGLVAEHSGVQTDQPVVDRIRPRLAPRPALQGRVGEQSVAFREYHPCIVA